MQDAQPSRTALRVAIRRAAHQLFDVPKVLDDPWAVPILGADAERYLSPRKHRGQISRSIRAFIVARSRVAEDELARAVDRGTTQFVVLGAGLDTFAYRNPYPESTLRVFEVDHPATQAWKQGKLAAAKIPIPSSLKFAPVDFERQTLADGLASAGFDRDRPTFFSWLGVTMYLTPEALESTFAYIASTRRGGGLTFDYAVPSSSLGWIERIALRSLTRRVAKAGEPFRTYFEPSRLREQLARTGFSQIVDLGAGELNERYFSGRADGLRVRGTIGRIASATLSA